MITWSNGTHTGAPHFMFPKDTSAYEVDMYNFGELWCTTLTAKSFRIVTDYFRTQEEAYEFLDAVLNVLVIKYPNAVCSNFSLLTKE